MIVESSGKFAGWGRRLLSVARLVSQLDSTEQADWNTWRVDGREAGPVTIMAQVEHDIKIGKAGWVVATREARVALTQGRITDTIVAKWMTSQIQLRIAEAKVSAVIADPNEAGETRLIVTLDKVLALADVPKGRFVLAGLIYADDGADQYLAVHNDGGGWTIPNEFANTLRRVEDLLGVRPPRQRRRLD